MTQWSSSPGELDGYWIQRLLASPTACWDGACLSSAWILSPGQVRTQRARKSQGCCQSVWVGWHPLGILVLAFSKPSWNTARVPLSHSGPEAQTEAENIGYSYLGSRWNRFLPIAAQWTWASPSGNIKLLVKTISWPAQPSPHWHQGELSQFCGIFKDIVDKCWWYS